MNGSGSPGTGRWSGTPVTMTTTTATPVPAGFGSPGDTRNSGPGSGCRVTGRSADSREKGIIPVVETAEHGNAGTALRNSLWNLLFRVVSSTDFSRIAWTTILRGACLSFLKEPIDELPLSDNDASRLALKARFLALPDHRVYDLFEFLLTDDHARLNEMDPKLIRRGLNELLEREGAPGVLYRDRFRPYHDFLGFDEMAEAGETVRLFDMAAAQRHMSTAMAYLSRRPEPSFRGAVREAVLAVTAVAREISAKDVAGGGESPPVIVGSGAHAAKAAGIPPELLAGIEALLRRAHAVSGLPIGGGASPGGAAGIHTREAPLLCALAL